MLRRENASQPSKVNDTELTKQQQCRFHSGGELSEVVWDSGEVDFNWDSATVLRRTEGVASHTKSGSLEKSPSRATNQAAVIQRGGSGELVKLLLPSTVDPSGYNLLGPLSLPLESRQPYSVGGKSPVELIENKTSIRSRRNSADGHQVDNFTRVIPVVSAPVSTHQSVVVHDSTSKANHSVPVPRIQSTTEVKTTRNFQAADLSVEAEPYTDIARDSFSHYVAPSATDNANVVQICQTEALSIPESSECFPRGRSTLRNTVESSWSARNSTQHKIVGEYNSAENRGPQHHSPMKNRQLDEETKTSRRRVADKTQNRKNYSAGGNLSRRRPNSMRFQRVVWTMSFGIAATFCIWFTVRLLSDGGTRSKLAMFVKGTSDVKFYTYEETAVIDFLHSHTRSSESIEKPTSSQPYELFTQGLITLSYTPQVDSVNAASFPSSALASDPLASPPIATGRDADDSSRAAMVHHDNAPSVPDKAALRDEILSDAMGRGPDGIMIESGGLYGQSMIRMFDLRSGSTLFSKPLPPTHFAEGVCMIGDMLFVLTWREYRLLVYKISQAALRIVAAGGRAAAAAVRNKDAAAAAVDGFSLAAAFKVDLEGWGLATDGNRVWMTTGRDDLHELDIPWQDIERQWAAREKLLQRANDGAEGVRKLIEAFETELIADAPEILLSPPKKITCFGEPLRRVNELQYDTKRNTLWGNIFLTYLIVELDIATGACKSILSLSNIYDPYASVYKKHYDVGQDVMNGIAMHPNMEELEMIVTGKRWPRMYFIRAKETEPTGKIDSWQAVNAYLPEGFMRFHMHHQ